MQLMLPELISIMVVSFAVMEGLSKVLYQISVHRQRAYSGTGSVFAQK
jgi:hypothetical protein